MKNTGQIGNDLEIQAMLEETGFVHISQFVQGQYVQRKIRHPRTQVERPKLKDTRGTRRMVTNHSDDTLSNEPHSNR
jgi:hypothetical protein